MNWKWIVACALLALNLISFFLFAIDKARAQRSAWRIKEKTLLLSCACFGALGGFCAMRLFRHKTQHASFTITVPVLLVVEIAIVAALFILVP